MESDELSSCGDEVNFETQTDMIILLDNIKCQTNNRSSQRQAFVALATILNLGEKSQNYFRQAGGLEEIKEQLIEAGYELSMVPVALFCLACAVKDNVSSKMDVLSRDLLSTLHQIFVSVRNQECLQSAAFFLACLVSNNVKGQHLAYETGCVEDLLLIVRELVQNESMDEKQWMTMTRSVFACFSNPQNENNQRLSSCVIPHALKVISDWTDGRIVQHALTMVGLVIHNNVSNQKRFRSCGGIDILSCLIAKLVPKIGQKEDKVCIDVLTSALGALDFAVAENKQNAVHAFELGIVTQILILFQNDYVCVSDVKIPLLALAQILEHADVSREPKTVAQCQQLMIQVMTNTEPSQDDEFWKLIKYIMALCKEKGTQNGNEKGSLVHGMNTTRNRSLGYHSDVDNRDGLQKSIGSSFSKNRSADALYATTCNKNPLRSNRFSMGNNDSKEPDQCSMRSDSFQENENIFNSKEGGNLYHITGSNINNNTGFGGQTDKFDSVSWKQQRSMEFRESNGSNNKSQRIVANDDNDNNNNNYGNNDNNNGEEDNQSSHPNLKDVSNFMNGICGDGSERTTMIAVMAIQEKQMQMFSQIQSLISSIMPESVSGQQAVNDLSFSSAMQYDESTLPESSPQLSKQPHQQTIRPSPIHDIEFSSFPPIPNPLSRTLKSSSNINIENNSDLPTPKAQGQKLKSNFQQNIQNVSLNSNTATGKTSKTRLTSSEKMSKHMSASFSNLGAIHNDDSVMKSKANIKSRISRSIKSNSSLNILSACNTYNIDEDCSKEAKTSGVKTSSKYGDHEKSDMLTKEQNCVDGDNDDDDSDSLTVMSCSTIDYTGPLQFDLNKTSDTIDEIMLSKTSTPRHTVSGHKKGRESTSSGSQGDPRDDRKGMRSKSRSKSRAIPSQIDSANQSLLSSNALPDFSGYQKDDRKGMRSRSKSKSRAIPSQIDSANQSLLSSNALPDFSCYEKISSIPHKPPWKKPSCQDTDKRHVESKSKIGLTHNVRNVKAIPSIQLATHANVLGEWSHSRRDQSFVKPSPRVHSDLNESFESAVKELFISNGKCLTRKGRSEKKDKVNNISTKTVADHKLRKPPKEGSVKKLDISTDYKPGKKRHTCEDKDSGFGGCLEHESEVEVKGKGKKSMSHGDQDCGKDSEINHKSHYRNSLHRQTRSKIKNDLESRSCDGEMLRGKVEVDYKKMREKHEPNLNFYSPQPQQTWTRDIMRKRVYGAIDGGTGALSTKYGTSTSKRLCQKDPIKDEIEEKLKSSKEKLKTHVKSIASLQCTPKGIKEDKKDVYAFTSHSETAMYPSSPDTDISTRSLQRSMRKKRLSPNSSSNGRRSRVPYSDQEILNLRHGVAMLGTRWQQIISVYQFHPSRTAVDLMEKFKRLMQSSKAKSDKIDQKCKDLPFSIDEVRRLTRGVKMFGHNWKAILAGERFLPGRTHQDLRNKWRVLSRNLFNKTY